MTQGDRVERVLKWPKGRRSEANMPVLVLVKATEASVTATISV